MGTFAAGHLMDPATGRPVAGQVLQVRHYTTNALLSPEGGPVTTGARGGYGRFVVAGVDAVTLQTADSDSKVDLVSVEKQLSGTSATVLGPPIASASALPTGAEPGEGRIAQDTGHLWQWDGSVWVDMGSVRGPAGQVTDEAVAGALTQPASTAALASAFAVREPYLRPRVVPDWSGSSGTDNYPALQSAIDACAPGGTVMVGAKAGGTMFCSQTLVIDKPIKLTSEGVVGHLDYSNRLIFPADTIGIHVKINDAKGLRPSNFQIENLWLHSRSTALTPGDSGHGILVTDGRGRIENVVIENFGGHGLHMRAGASVGGGNITKSTVTRLRVYGVRRDGINFLGTDVQAILVEQPDIVACYGWGINIEQANFNQMVFPHFDQRHNGSPGIIRDCANSNDYGYIYAENGANGTTVLLDKTSERESTYAYFEYSAYAGNLVFDDRTTSKSAMVIDRSKRSIRRDLSIISTDGQHQYRLDSGVGNVNGLTLTYVPGPGSQLTQKTVCTYSRGTDQLFVGSRLSPTGAQSLGAASARWVNGFFSGFVGLGTTTTANRPGAATSGAGAVLYDSDLKRPIFSDGAVWRDAAGTAV